MLTFYFFVKRRILIKIKITTFYFDLLTFFHVTVCTPVGFSRMFTVMGQLVIKPQVSQSSR